MSIVESDGPPSWSLDASKTGESTKCPWVGVVEGTVGEKKNFCPLVPTLLTPSLLPTGILYSPQFRSHQETKMAACRTQRSTSTISRENRWLWTVYPFKGEWGQLQSWKNTEYSRHVPFNLTRPSFHEAGLSSKILLSCLNRKNRPQKIASKPELRQ